jgi:hypothetical protein
MTLKALLAGRCLEAPLVVTQKHTCLEIRKFVNLKDYTAEVSNYLFL